MITPQEYAVLTAMDAAYLSGVRKHQDEMRAKYTRENSDGVQK
jgi:hypothetical protein